MKVEISTLVELQAINEALSGNYVLVNNIDANKTHPYNVDDWDEGNYVAGDWVKHGGSGTIKTYYCHADTTDGQLPTDTDFWTEMWVSAEGWLPLGKSWTYRFTGSFDGQGFSVSNLFINSSSSAVDAGLFGCTQGTVSQGLVKNIAVLDANISGTSSYTGVIVGRLGATLKNFRASGTVHGKTGQVGTVGITNRYSILHGHIYDGYSSVVVTSASNTVYRGGIAGIIDNNSEVENCYFIGTVDRVGEQRGGALCGAGGSLIKNSFWDINICIWITTSGGGVGKTTDEMKDINTFIDAGWDIVNIDKISGLTQDLAVRNAAGDGTTVLRFIDGILTDVDPI